MENLNQIQGQNQIIGIPEIPVLEENKLEPAALPVEKKEVEIVPESKLDTVKKILKTTKESIEAALQLLDFGEDKALLAQNQTTLVSAALVLGEAPKAEMIGKIVEGVYDGEHMVSGEGQIYNIPPNYASKSKLVEGDLLKLTITPKGAFIYKQIGPIERNRLRGSLLHNKETGEFAVAVDDKVFRVLKASITYFHGDEGDEVVLLTPKGAQSRWAAVENIVKRSPVL